MTLNSNAMKNPPYRNLRDDPRLASARFRSVRPIFMDDAKDGLTGQPSRRAVSSLLEMLCDSPIVGPAPTFLHGGVKT
jgi:hypothetical protein